MRTVDVYNNDRLAGQLIETSPKEYVFRYEDSYYKDPQTGGISFSLPKTQQEYHSTSIFPFFTNMLPEGGNRRIVCRLCKVDEEDFFGMLQMMRGADFIGAINLR
ncbi:MAG: HipA N-terminal domain-containing protein [Bacteroidales bacterium]|nr:HipA N-terminal domain-containing protein [Bacteroidales bacterium]